MRDGGPLRARVGPRRAVFPYTAIAQRHQLALAEQPQVVGVLRLVRRRRHELSDELHLDLGEQPGPLLEPAQCKANRPSVSLAAAMHRLPKIAAGPAVRATALCLSGGARLPARHSVKEQDTGCEQADEHPHAPPAHRLCERVRGPGCVRAAALAARPHDRHRRRGIVHEDPGRGGFDALWQAAYPAGLLLGRIGAVAPGLASSRSAPRPPRQASPAAPDRARNRAARDRNRRRGLHANDRWGLRAPPDQIVARAWPRSRIAELLVSSRIILESSPIRSRSRVGFVSYQHLDATHQQTSNLLVRGKSGKTGLAARPPAWWRTGRDPWPRSRRIRPPTWLWKTLWENRRSGGTLVWHRENSHHFTRWVVALSSVAGAAAP
jgi:hypothetical protein